MRLRRLQIVRLPGIEPGFELASLGPGINVIVGPNAAGKSSVVRALHASLYREASSHAGVHVEAWLEDEASGRALKAQRLGEDLYWTADGARTEPPPLPDYRLIGCYSLRVEDLLGASPGPDAAIADHIARELAGGYDLRAVRERAPFALKTTHGRREADAFVEADRSLRQQSHQRERLQRDEADLERLRAEKQAAAEAREAAAPYAQALEWLTARRERIELDQRLATFPAGMDRLRGDELETLEQRRSQLTRHQNEREAAVGQRADAEAKRSATGLEEAALSEAEIDDYRPAVNRLQDWETRLETQCEALARAERRVSAAVDALGGAPEQAVRLEPTTVARMERDLESKRDCDARLAAVEAELERLLETEPAATDRDRLRSALQELLRWLAAPTAPRSRGAYVLATIAVILAGGGAVAALAWLVHPGFAGLLLPLALGGAYLAWIDPGAEQRRSALQRFRETGLDQPHAWSHASVTQRLDTLERDLLDAERRARDLERRTTLEREQKRQREARESVRKRLGQIARAVGHDVEALDASLQRWIRLTGEWDEARTEVARIQGERERLRQQAESARQMLNAFLQPFDEAPAETAATANAYAQRLDRLAQRLRDREQARADIASAARALERVDAEIASDRQGVQAVFDQAGLAPDDEAALRQRLERLAEWRGLKRQRDDAHAREAAHAERIGDRPTLRQQVEADDEAGLKRQYETLQEQAGQLESLVAQITQIESEIDRAGQERALERARAERQGAEETLRDALDEALFAEAGRFLLERVESEHEHSAQPAALRRAKDWFERFTRHQFELVFDHAGDTAFGARETASGERRALSELSTGTHMQLLLAVRIAFALQAEHGRSRLPLVLDEALTTADPERFEAVAASLSLLAAEDGRQVFYLTAQPDDAAHWLAQEPDAHCIDLGALRRGQHALTDTGALAPPQRATIPAPGAATPEDYAITLGVPPIRLWEPAEAIHSFHLLRDDLALLHDLLERGVDRLGPLATLLASDAAAQALPTDQRARLHTRIDAARRWLEARRRGQGRPLDRAGLEASGAITETFIDRVAALNDRLGGDGEALVEQLKAGDVPRFQRDKREALEAWLTEHGYIDPREPRSRAELELTIEGAFLAHWDDTAEVRRSARRLLAALEAALAAGA